MQMIDDVNLVPLDYEGVPETSVMERTISVSNDRGIPTQITDKSGVKRENFSSIYEKLSCVQGELTVEKGRFNEFGNFSYRSADDILAAVKPLLSQYRLVLYMDDCLRMIGERYYIQSTVTIVDLDNGTKHSVNAWAREQISKPKMDEAQVTGSTSSYARKYALAAMFCIDSEKDPDAIEGDQTPSKNPAEPPKTAIICPQCKKPIKGLKKSDGTIVTAQQVHDSCNGFCLKCYQANKRAIEAAMESVNEGEI